MFTSPDTFSSDHHKLSSPLRVFIVCVSTSSPPPHSLSESVEDPLLFTLLLDQDFIQELRRRRQTESDPPEKIQRRSGSSFREHLENLEENLLQVPHPNKKSRSDVIVSDCKTLRL